MLLDILGKIHNVLLKANHTKLNGNDFANEACSNAIGLLFNN